MSDSLIVLYSTGCPRCKVLKQKLDSNGTKYSLVDDVDTMSLKGIETVPVLEVDGKLMNFPEALKWAEKGE